MMASASKWGPLSDEELRALPLDELVERMDRILRDADASPTTRLVSDVTESAWVVPMDPPTRRLIACCAFRFLGRSEQQEAYDCFFDLLHALATGTPPSASGRTPALERWLRSADNPFHEFERELAVGPGFAPEHRVERVWPRLLEIVALSRSTAQN